jgi:hypothetical protein
LLTLLLTPVGVSAWAEAVGCPMVLSRFLCPVVVVLEELYLSLLLLLHPHSLVVAV